jgi:hypothetical protein
MDDLGPTVHTSHGATFFRANRLGSIRSFRENEIESLEINGKEKSFERNLHTLS